MMDHANIARVVDAGATQSGRPYFVMELVRGTKITEYCDEDELGIAERIRLFIQVCHAVHHAHQKGIIHRDIKPSNVLVTVNDGEPVVKVIDFGVAKATHGSLTDATLFTQFHQMIGTPSYMSPEQAEMTSLDIDTRSDIYSLGVLLYELVRRHRLAFAAGAAITLSLLAGLAVSTWLFFKEKAAVKEQSRLRGEAETARATEQEQRVRAEAGEKAAKTESARSEEIPRFLKEMLEGVKPSVARGRDSTMLLDILDATVARLDTELKHQPEVEAGLRSTIGRVYRELAKDDKAEPIFRRELELRKQIHGEEHLDVVAGSERLQSSKSADPASKRAVMEKLVCLYEEWDRLAPKRGKAAQAAEWKKRLADIDKNAAASALPASQPTR